MKRHALFTGVDQYTDASFQNLRYSVSDAATQDGSHLQICANDRLAYLRHNRAGIPVNLLEEVTNGRGFNRAFLLLLQHAP